MMAFLSSNFLSLWNFHLSREVEIGGVSRATAAHTVRKNFNGWIGRWGNEGGAIDQKEIATNPPFQSPGETRELPGPPMRPRL